LGTHMKRLLNKHTFTTFTHGLQRGPPAVGRETKQFNGRPRRLTRRRSSLGT
jgi:hypothetical protein